MTDYTELIWALRKTATFTQTNEMLSKREQKLENLAFDAADAIEELSKTVKDLTTKVECSPMQISEKAFDRAIEAWNERARKAVQDGQ